MFTQPQPGLITVLPVSGGRRYFTLHKPWLLLARRLGVADTQGPRKLHTKKKTGIFLKRREGKSDPNRNLFRWNYFQISNLPNLADGDNQIPGHTTSCLYFHFESSLSNSADNFFYLCFFGSLSVAVSSFSIPNVYVLAIQSHLSLPLSLPWFSLSLTSPYATNTEKNPHPSPSRGVGLPEVLHFPSRFSLLYKSHHKGTRGESLLPKTLSLSF